MISKSTLKNFCYTIPSNNLLYTQEVEMHMKFSLCLFTVLFLAAFTVCCAPPVCAEDAVALPSRFEGSAPPPETPRGDAELMVEEWIAATGNATPYMANRTKNLFQFGVTTPVILCKAGGITDIELEPNERVTNFAVSDENKWSVSAAWSGTPDELVTHVLLRTFFPGVKSNIVIHTDRRTYSIDLSSSLDGPHMTYVGFKYPEPLKSAEETIPQGKYRDLLARYGLIDGEAETAPPPKQLVDGADLDFGYSIEPAGEKKKLPWTPRSVYAAAGRTYFVMPEMKEQEGRPSIFIITPRGRIITPYKIVKDGLYAVDRLFDEAVLTFGGDEIYVRKMAAK
jgi:type IV secretion system protein VirB9